MGRDLIPGALCGYEDACGMREELECPFSVCDGCPLETEGDTDGDGGDDDDAEARLRQG